MTAPVSEYRALKQANIVNEQLLQLEYFREQINIYGVDCDYFRYDVDFFSTSPSSTISNLTYGESPTSQYTLSAPMVVYMDMQQDSPMLKRFGIETSVSNEIYFCCDIFTETWRDIIGTPTTGLLTSTINGTITNFSGVLSGDIVNSDISGYTSANTVTISGDISGNQSFSFIRYPKAVNPLLALPYYFRDRVVLGSLSGNIAGTIDASGNGSLSGVVSGVLGYFNELAVNRGPNFKISPQVGDFVRLKAFDEVEGNYEEYEITRILDRTLTDVGLNPLLGKYIWGCAVVRRDASHEAVTGTLQQELFTPNLITENTWTEVVSNKIHDYTTTAIDSVDKAASDNAYGGY